MLLLVAIRKQIFPLGVIAEKYRKQHYNYYYIQLVLFYCLKMDNVKQCTC